MFALLAYPAIAGVAATALGAGALYLYGSGAPELPYPESSSLENIIGKRQMALLWFVEEDDIRSGLHSKSVTGLCGYSKDIVRRCMALDGSFLRTATALSVGAAVPLLTQGLEGTLLRSNRLPLRYYARDMSIMNVKDASPAVLADFKSQLQVALRHAGGTEAHDNLRLWAERCCGLVKQGSPQNLYACVLVLGHDEPDVSMVGALIFTMCIEWQANTTTVAVTSCGYGLTFVDAGAANLDLAKHTIPWQRKQVLRALETAEVVQARPAMSTHLPGTPTAAEMCQVLSIVCNK